MKKIVLAIMLLAHTLFSADNFTFEKVNNAQEVSSKKFTLITGGLDKFGNLCNQE